VTTSLDHAAAFATSAGVTLVNAVAELDGNWR
jgi:hypothetical protein